MEETREYIFEIIDDKKVFESWKVIHNKKGGYTENDVVVRIGGESNDTFLYISDDDNSIYIAKEQVEWLRDILNEIDLGEE